MKATKAGEGRASHEEKEALIRDLSKRILYEEGFAARVLDLIAEDQGAGKYIYEKALRRASEEDPSRLASHVEGMLKLLGGNTFIRSGAIIALSNVIPFLRPESAKAAVEAYLEEMKGDSLICAGNAVRNSWKIAKSLPGFEPLITAAALGVAGRTYLYRGEPSPECREIMLGGAVESFSRYFESASDRDGMLAFITAASKSGRKSTAKRASEFLAGLR